VDEASAAAAATASQQQSAVASTTTLEQDPITTTETPVGIQEGDRAASTAPAEIAVQSLSNNIPPQTRPSSSIQGNLDQGSIAGSGPAMPDITRYARTFFGKLDVVSALDPGHDRLFRQRIERGGEHFSTGELRQALTELERGIGEAGLTEDTKKTLRIDIENIQSDIASITNDKRMRHYVELLGVRLLLTPLPILLPLLAKPTQFKGASVLIASYVKTCLLAFGLMFVPTADSKVIRRHTMNRDLANNIQALLLLANAIPTAKAKKVSDGVGYNVAVGLAGFAALMLAFYGTRFMKDQYNRTRYGAAKPNRLAHYATGLSQDSKDFLTQSASSIDRQAKLLEDERSAFKEEGRRLTDTADWQVGQILGGLHKLQNDLLRLSGVSEGTPGRNPDKISKAIMFGVSAAVLAAPIVPVTGLFIAPNPETIPLVDLVIDYAFTMFHMGAIMNNPSASLQESRDAFKQWVGYSGVLAYCFGANAAKGDPVSQGGKAFAAFATGLSVANSTVATPQGIIMAEVVAAILAKFRRGDTEGARRDLQAVGETIIDELDAAPPLEPTV
jgi:hypothetical protein